MTAVQTVKRRAGRARIQTRPGYSLPSQQTPRLGAGDAELRPARAEGGGDAAPGAGRTQGAPGPPLPLIALPTPQKKT